MEVVAAVALAGNVLQFIQTGFAILSKGNQLKRSHDGRLKQHAELDLIISDLDSRVKPLEPNSDAKLNALVTKCRTVGSELRDALLHAKIKGKGSLWSSYRQALSIVWNRDTFDEMERRLGSLRDEMGFHLQTVVRFCRPQSMKKLSRAG